MTSDATPRRLTRAESRERTRRQLLEAAADIFARRGYAAASVEEIAESAGFSVGAVYSNFANKDELFAALMTDRAVNHMDEVADIFDSAEALSQDPLQGLGRMLIAIADKDLHVAVLKTEFWLHAVRNPELMRIEADASARTLTAVREILTGVLDRNDVDQSVVSVDDFATVTLALFGGLIRQRRTDPSRVSDDMFGQAIRWLIAGMPKNSDRRQ
ncbi:TetR/AcrR family transcriptional regulator [Mycolicibacterium fluoranthenivorans]|jgi:AcrR family transcriptional regulator|uniref:TetR/AcrR family transcriptional regulator n=1 Tax=Mycolicibacterium fluoranthenivorans TaxID=258505 RepID=A0A7G8PAX9_9MYCO|nr:MULTISPECIES: TetR family transcriptional regulator [Mycobacteriaceae]MCV7254803.1 TetR/AcrR family transcriptional regulator [Mycobacterium hackensackense]QNJ91495.1 TetR/AcrR family transcriptional regulator [Mycolicibacterium fluoranthenivorans]